METQETCFREYNISRQTLKSVLLFGSIFMDMTILIKQYYYYSF